MCGSLIFWRLYHTEKKKYSYSLYSLGTCTQEEAESGWCYCSNLTLRLRKRCGCRGRRLNACTLSHTHKHTKGWCTTRFVDGGLVDVLLGRLFPCGKCTRQNMLKISTECRANRMWRRWTRWSAMFGGLKCWQLFRALYPPFHRRVRKLSNNIRVCVLCFCS